MATPSPPGTLSYPPIPGPIAGIYAVNAPWAQWFRELWNRVGGPDAPTNTELHTLLMSQAPGGPVDTSTLLETVGDFFVQQGSGQDAAAGAAVADMSGRLEALETDAQDTAPALLTTLQRRLDDLEAFVLSSPGLVVPPAATITVTGLWNWSTVDGTGDPGAPNAAFDTAALPLALRISRQTLDNHEASSMLATVQPGDMLTIQSPSVSTIWVRFNVNAALSHFPTYFSYPGTVLATGAGGQPTANMPVTITLTRLSGLEDAGAQAETSWIRTTIDLDSRVTALENQPPEAIAQSVALALKRLDDLEQLVMMNVSPPMPPGVAYVGAVNQFTQPQIINAANTLVPVVPVGGGPSLTVNGSGGAGGTGQVGLVINGFNGAASFIFTRTQGSPTLPAVVTTQPLFTINGRGYDGSGNPYGTSAAQILFNAEVPGGYDATHHAASIRFSTISTLAGALLTEVARLQPSGCLSVGTTADSGVGTVRANKGVYTEEQTAVIHATLAWTGGATGNVPTLPSGPVSGPPTKWLPFDDAGTLRHVPSW